MQLELQSGEGNQAILQKCLKHNRAILEGLTPSSSRLHSLELEIYRNFLCDFAR